MAEVTSAITNNTTPGYKCLKDVVKRTLFEDGETTMHKYALYKGYAIDFLRDYMQDAARDVKTVELDVDEMGRAKLPDDYIDYVKIGYREADRMLIYIKDNTLATIWDEDNCGNDIKNPTPSDVDRDRLPFWNNSGTLYSQYTNTWGEFTGGQYGYGNGLVQDGFKIYKDHIILTSTNNREKVIIEYICSGWVYGEETMIPISAEEACKSYIRWKDVENRRDSPYNLVERFRVRFTNNRRIAVARKQKLSPEDIYYQMRNAFMMAPNT